MKIALFITGGTFDKEYNELTGTLYFRKSHIREMLSLGRSRIPLKIQTLMMIDSLNMTANHRKSIAKACLAAKEKRILITHGTDTMENTARYLAHQVTGKTIVLTGAMVPYKFGSSDGLFNLGSAMAFAQVLPPGVYIAMNGRFFEWKKVKKDRARGYFKEQ